MDIKVGDDVTVAGKVTKIENGCYRMETKNGNHFWIDPEDIKTHRPGKKEGDTK